MRPAEAPANEEERLAALERAEILDTPPEAPFDTVAQLAASICEVPIALVSLVDRDRQWFKAKVGLAVSETARELAFCAHAIHDDAPLIVRDALTDARFADNPLVVGDPNIRFYAGVPLHGDDGSSLGTLCVIDRVPRELTPKQLQALSMLARQASTEIRLRSEAARGRRQHIGQAATPIAGSLEESAPPSPETAPSRAKAAGDGDGPGAVRPGAVVSERYLVEQEIGSGGMGVVYAARDQRERREVAIKFLRPELMNERSVLRFAREARAVMSLHNPHVCQVLDAGNTDDDVPFLVMERLAGEELDQRLARVGRLPLGDALDITLQACDGLAEAHERAIVHRDLKPANIFLLPGAGSRTLVKVLDFGIAKSADFAASADGKRLTDAHTLMGSPQYMAPEQLFAASDVDVRADVWSLGAMLYAMLAGRPPFTGAGLRDICTAVMLEPPPALRALRPEVSPALAALITSCLDKAREGRPADARALAGELTAIAL
jgi:tRNA A-37 threonylcarbamoyl transferase component Bud32